jgi:hypothetical protein
MVDNKPLMKGVKAGGNGGRIYLPVTWIGTEVMVFQLEDKRKTLKSLISESIKISEELGIDYVGNSIREDLMEWRDGL